MGRGLHVPKTCGMEPVVWKWTGWDWVEKLTGSNSLTSEMSIQRYSSITLQVRKSNVMYLWNGKVTEQQKSSHQADMKQSRLLPSGYGFSLCTVHHPVSKLHLHFRCTNPFICEAARKESKLRVEDSSNAFNGTAALRREGSGTA